MQRDPAYEESLAHDGARRLVRQEAEAFEGTAPKRGSLDPAGIALSFEFGTTPPKPARQR